MSGTPTKYFNLPWHQYEQYWICLFAKNGPFSAPLKQALAQVGLQASPDGLVMKTDREWKLAWDPIFAVLQKANAFTEVEVAITSAEQAFSSANAERKTPAAVQRIAESLWLGTALMENRILCYLQPVVSAKDKIFGYESFARYKSADGTIIGGEAIVAAARALEIEYMIDRHLHIHAIKTFVSSDFNGFLFINFFPGFIHRPAVYLEGLSETARQFGVIAKHLVLDFTRAEVPRDIMHLKSVCDYGRSRGYSVALDDMESMDGMRKLMPEIKPDFVKIDMQLARQVDTQPKREIIRQMVEFAHNAGSTIIAEGVETEEMYKKLKELGVDLFQGYYFSPPVPVEAAIRKDTGT